MQQARVRRTACMQNLRVEVAKVQTLPATLKRSRHPRGTKIVKTCRVGVLLFAKCSVFA